MKQKRKSKVLMLAMLLSVLFVPFNYAVMASSDNPDVTIIQSTKLPTNEDILITISTNDDLSGIKEVVLPDGTKVTEKNTTYTVTENGEYKIKVYDNAGNETEGIVAIDNIDKVNPVLELIPDITEPTNKDVVITAKTNDIDSGIKEIILPDGTKVTEGSTTYTVTENATYTFKAIDIAGNQVEKTITITNIDKVLPVITIEPYNTEPTNQDITVKATVDKGTLNQESFTFTENGSFTFIATDEVGNKTEKEVVITNINKVLPVITIKPYETNWTNQDIIVKATVDKGTLNQESFTFTENGSFTFIATDEAGNKTEKEVVITNIDKVNPELKIIVGK